MSKYKLEKKSASRPYCEVCGDSGMPTQSAVVTVLKSLNEFHKDGTIKIHYTCSKHIVDLYDKILKEIENNKSKIIK